MVEAFFTGLGTATAAVTIRPDAVARQDFQLQSGAKRTADGKLEMDAFVVAATRETDASAIAVNEQRFASNITSVVAADEFGTIPDTNPGELLKWLPGVGVEYFANNIVGVDVRGLGSANTEVNFDGMGMASAYTESEGRGFEMQFASAADIARVEIRKIPLPEDSANALGGSINLTRRSAFEASRRRITYRALFMSDAEHLTFAERDGPGDRQQTRWRPNWQVQWTEPVTRNFGFSLSVGQSESISMTHWSQPFWNYGSTTQANAAKARLDSGQPLLNSVSVYNPALTRQLLHDAPKKDGPRRNASLRLDWRPMPELTLNMSLSGTDARNETADDIRYRWRTEQTGSGDPQSVTPTTTVGRRNGGGIYHDTPLWRDMYAPTMGGNFEARWRKNALTLSLKGGYSVSRHKFYDMEHGFFNSTSGGPLPHTGVGAGTANPMQLTVTFSDITYYGPRSITAVDNANNPVEWWKNSTVRIGGARSRPGGSKEILTTAKLFAKYDFSFQMPFSLQLGFDYREQFRNRYYITNYWRFVGRDRLPNTADDTASHIAAENLPPHRDSVYDLPPIERISLSKLYSLYVTNPEWFQYLPNESFRDTVSTPYEMTEVRLAPYSQFDLRLFRNRLRLTGGMRIEETEAEGRGFLNDPSRGYQKDPDGSVRQNSNGDPILLPGLSASSLEFAQLTMFAKGAARRSKKFKQFPSLHSTYNLTENIQFQLAWAQTMSQNALNRSVLPRIIVDHEVQDSGALGNIEIRNPNLKPWIANNYEARVSYFNRTGGVIGLGGFRKMISNLQSEFTTLPLTVDELAEWGFGPEYDNYEITTHTNTGSGILEGGELEVRQSLNPFLPSWARGFQVRGSLQYNNLRGTASGGDFGNMFDQRHTLNLSYRARKLSVNLGYMKNGRRMNNPNLTAAGRRYARVYAPQYMYDFSVEYSLTRWAKIFVSGRNITNEQRRREDEVPDAPAYSLLNSANNQGSSITIGITGSFDDLQWRMPWQKSREL